VSSSLGFLAGGAGLEAKSPSRATWRVGLLGRVFGPPQIPSAPGAAREIRRTNRSTEREPANSLGDKPSVIALSHWGFRTMRWSSDPRDPHDPRFKGRAGQGEWTADHADHADHPWSNARICCSKPSSRVGCDLPPRPDAEPFVPDQRTLSAMPVETWSLVQSRPQMGADGRRLESTSPGSDDPSCLWLSASAAKWQCRRRRSSASICVHLR